MIVVVSVSADEATYEPVLAKLEDAGAGAVLVLADKVLSGELDFRVAVVGDSVALSVGDISFAVADVRAGWWRKPHWLQLHRDDHRLSEVVRQECLGALWDVFGTVPHRRWLNSPLGIEGARSKLKQSGVAAAVGFDVPTTVVASSWTPIRDLADASRDGIVYKSFRGAGYTSEGSSAVFTRRLSKQEVDEASVLGSPWPGMFQPFIRKEREWRVTVVGQDVHSALIETSGPATIDWRAYQGSDHVRMSQRELPGQVRKQCAEVCAGLGLGFAAIDLIEDAVGRFWFLEANPNGQYVWLEEMFGISISGSVAAALLALEATA